MGSRLKAAAEAAGLGAYDIAEKMGVRAPTVYRWWSGGSRLAGDSLQVYALLVGKHRLWLEFGDQAAEYALELLQRWADATSAGTAGGKALGEIVPQVTPDSEGLAGALERGGPEMIAAIEEIAGGAWQSLSEAEKGAALRVLVARLDRMGFGRRDTG